MFTLTNPPLIAEQRILLQRRSPAQYQHLLAAARQDEIAAERSLRHWLQNPS